MKRSLSDDIVTDSSSALPFSPFLRVFSEKSNLVCAIYGDVHTAAEKTNFAGE